MEIETLERIIKDQIEADKRAGVDSRKNKLLQEFKKDLEKLKKDLK